MPVITVGKRTQSREILSWVFSHIIPSFLLDAEGSNIPQVWDNTRMVLLSLLISFYCYFKTGIVELKKTLFTQLHRWVVNHKEHLYAELCKKWIYLPTSYFCLEKKEIRFFFLFFVHFHCEEQKITTCLLKMA